MEMAVAAIGEVADPLQEPECQSRGTAHGSAECHGCVGVGGELQACSPVLHDLGQRLWQVVTEPEQDPEVLAERVRYGARAGDGGHQCARCQVQAHDREIAAVVGVAYDPGGDMVATDQPQSGVGSQAQEPRNPLPGRRLRLLPPLPGFLDLSSLRRRR